MDEDDVSAGGVNFVPCIKWVRRGVAKANPEKIQLTEEELEAIINRTKDSLKVQVNQENSNDESGNVNSERNGNSTENDTEEDKYNFDKYDEEEDGSDALLGLGGLTVYASTSKDPYVTIDDDEDRDSEREDDVISPTDNLILVGHVEGDASILEVYVYNEGEGSLYVHHDYLLPAFPLCMEWLNFDPGESRPGSLCAVGSMDPVIQVWDLDLVECLEPAFKLGRKPRRKKGVPGYGHTDAVLDLSWNIHMQHILSSGSADQSVLLWDLENGQPHTKLDSFMEKVQTIEFHPFEAQTLLTGSCDKVVRVFDCREEGSFKSWSLPGEVERVVWNHFSPFHCFAGTSEGSVHCIDCRAERPLWQLKAHDKEVSGLTLSSQCPGLLLTAGSDGLLKAWDVAGDEPSFVHGRPLGVGGAQCLSASPDSPFVVAAGGDKKTNYFTVLDVCSNSAVETRFGSRELVRPVLVPDDSSRDAETMDFDQEPLPSTSSSSAGGPKRSVPKHKFKKYKKKK